MRKRKMEKMNKKTRAVPRSGCLRIITMGKATRRPGKKSLVRVYP
jgi:hypothetical protein